MSHWQNGTLRRADDRREHLHHRRHRISGVSPDGPPAVDAQITFITGVTVLGHDVVFSDLHSVRIKMVTG
jgi:hypothetical protein